MNLCKRSFVRQFHSHTHRGTLNRFNRRGIDRTVVDVSNDTLHRNNDILRRSCVHQVHEIFSRGVIAGNMQHLTRFDIHSVRRQVSCIVERFNEDKSDIFGKICDVEYQFSGIITDFSCKLTAVKCIVVVVCICEGETGAIICKTDRYSLFDCRFSGILAFRRRLRCNLFFGHFNTGDNRRRRIDDHIERVFLIQFGSRIIELCLIFDLADRSVRDEFSEIIRVLIVVNAVPVEGAAGLPDAVIIVEIRFTEVLTIIYKIDFIGKVVSNCHFEVTRITKLDRQGIHHLNKIHITVGSLIGDRIVETIPILFISQVLSPCIGNEFFIRKQNGCGISADIIVEMLHIGIQTVNIGNRDVGLNKANVFRHIPGLSILRIIYVLQCKRVQIQHAVCPDLIKNRTLRPVAVEAHISQMHRRRSNFFMADNSRKHLKADERTEQICCVGCGDSAALVEVRKERFFFGKLNETDYRTKNHYGIGSIDDRVEVNIAVNAFTDRNGHSNIGFGCVKCDISFDIGTVLELLIEFCLCCIIERNGNHAIKCSVCRNSCFQVAGNR